MAPRSGGQAAAMLWRIAISPRENRVTTATDDFYRDIIEGLSIHSGSAFERDVLATISRHDEHDLGAAFNKNQIASKMWLAEALLEAAGPEHANVTILGGWFGVLAAVLLHDPRFSIGKATSVDIDPRCEADRPFGERHARARRQVRRAHRRHARPRLRPADRERGRPARRRSRHQHELRASCGLRPLVRAHPARATARPPVERLFRLRPARQLRARPRGLSRPGADAARCFSRASGG